jgi:hypothetical protein
VILRNQGRLEAKHPADGSTLWSTGQHTLNLFPALVNASSVGIVINATRIDFIDEQSGIAVRSMDIPAELGVLHGYMTRYRNVLVVVSSSIGSVAGISVHE